MTSHSISSIGFVITAMNAVTLGLLLTNSYLCYNKAVDISQSEHRKDVDFYFIQLVNSMIFCFATMIALYTGIQSYILNPNFVLDKIVLWRVGEAIGRLCVSVGLCWTRMNYNPFDRK